LGDIRLRITKNFIGNAALTPAEFAQRQPDTTVGVNRAHRFADAAAGVLLFTDNANFFEGHVRGQKPLWGFQAHGGYNLRPRALSRS
jgi:hypothetical protein